MEDVTLVTSAKKDDAVNKNNADRRILILLHNESRLKSPLASSALTAGLSPEEVSPLLFDPLSPFAALSLHILKFLSMDTSTPRVIRIAAGGDEHILIPVTELPTDIEEIDEVLRAVNAPIAVWHDITVEYWRQGKLEQFDALLRKTLALREYYYYFASIS